MKHQSIPGRVMKLMVYLLLTGLAFVFAYPFLSMFVDSFKSFTDISNVNVKWIPREPVLSNYALAFKALNTLRAALNSAVLAGGATLGHLLSCSLAAYGFSRFGFPLKKLLFGVVILSIIIPAQTLIVPSYITFSNLGLHQTALPMLIPAWLGFGLRGGIFIFIFRQYFIKVPPSLEEAAHIDGCGPLKTFFTVIIPSAGATLIVVAILSLVWHWNDYYEPSIYLSSFDDFLLPQMLSMLPTQLANMQTQSVEQISQSGLQQEIQVLYHRGVVMAGSVICVLLPLGMYITLQRRFMEGIERSGLVE